MDTPAITVPDAPIPNSADQAFQAERDKYLNNSSDAFLKNPSLSGNYPSDVVAKDPIVPQDYGQSAANGFKDLALSSVDQNALARPVSFDVGDYNRFAKSSTFDKLGYNPLRPDQENLYHEAQSGLQRLGYAGAQLLTKTASYAMQNAGFLLGAPAALVTGDISKMNDNFLIKASDVLKDYAQNTYPIFKGTKYTSGSIWDKLASTDWWLDDATDRIALTAGMFLPAVLGAGGLALTGEKGLLTSTLPKLAKIPVEEYGPLAKAFVPKLFSAALKTDVGIGATDALTKYAGTLNMAELQAWNIIGQAGLNSKETQDAIKKNLKEQRDNGLDISDEEIDKRSAEGAKKSFWETVPLTLAGSFLEVPMMFSTAKGGKSILNKLYNSSTTEELLGNLKSSAPGIGKLSLMAGVTGLEHGQNESMQVAISRYNEDSQTIDAKTGKPKDVRGTIPGIFGDFLDNVNDPNGQNNIALGTIQGILMTLGGEASKRSSLFSKDGKSHYDREDEQKSQYLNIINQARLERRLWTGDLSIRNTDGVITDKDGNALKDQDKITDGALSLHGLMIDMALKQQAIKQGNIDVADKVDHSNLAGFAYNFFPDTHGMEHLIGWLGLERDNNAKDPNYEINNDISAEQQYQKNIKTLKELKKTFDHVQDNAHQFSDLNLDPKKPEDVIAAKYARGFLNAQVFAQYHTAATQSFLSDRLTDINSKLAAIQADPAIFKKTDLNLDKNGDPVYKAFSKPSTPSEKEFNNLLSRRVPVPDALTQTKDEYKTMLNKTELRKAFREHVAKQEPIVKKAEEATAKQQAAQAAPAPVVETLPAPETPGQPTPVTPVQNEIKQEPGQVPIEYSSNLETQDMGKWEGDIEANHEDNIQNIIEDKNRHNEPYGETGESLNQFMTRVGTEYTRILNTYPGNIAIVTHSSVIKMIKALTEGKDHDDILKLFQDSSTNPGKVYLIKDGNRTVYLVRHGETEDNVAKRLRRPTTQLTDKGREDIHKAAEQLKGKGITQIISSDFDRTRETSEGIAQALKNEPTPETSPILPQFHGKVIYSSAGTGKTSAVAKYPGQLVDGDQVLFDFLKSKNIPVTDTQHSGIALYQYLQHEPTREKALLKEFRAQIKSLANEGKTVLTASKYLRSIADQVFLSKGLNKMVKTFEGRGQTQASALRSAVALIKDENETFAGKADAEALAKPENLIEHVLTGKFPEEPIVTESLEDRISPVRDLEQLSALEKDLLIDIAKGKYNHIAVRVALDNKRKEIAQSVNFEDIHKGTVLIMSDRKIYFKRGLAMVTGKDDKYIYVKPWASDSESVSGQAAQRIPADQLKKHIDYIWRDGLRDEDITPTITPEVIAASKANIKANDTLNKSDDLKKQIEDANPDELDETPC